MPAHISAVDLEEALAKAASENASFRHQGPTSEDQSPVFSSSFSPVFTPVFTPGSQPAAPSFGGQFGNTASTPDMSSLAQGQIIYQKHCTKCKWSSLASYDPRAYRGCVADYELHIKEAHVELKDSEETSSRSKEVEEYEKATQMRDVLITRDDSNLNLSDARYWRRPFSWKNIQLGHPVAQKPVCSLTDGEPYGLEVNNKALIRGMHDRSYKNLKLKFFSDANIKVIPGQQENIIAFDKSNSGQLLTTKEWKELADEKEAIMAAHNYMELNRDIHPLDSGPQILYKVMLQKFLMGGTSAKQLEGFFNSVTWELANRAAKSELPYKHAELLLKWDQSCRFSGPVSAGPTNLDKHIKDAIKRGMQDWRNDKTLSPSSKKARPSHNWCGLFNRNGGCNNTQSDSGCIDNSNKSWKHGCNVKTDGKLCNSHEHNRESHPK